LNLDKDEIKTVIELLISTDPFFKILSRELNRYATSSPRDAIYNLNQSSLSKLTFEASFACNNLSIFVVPTTGTILDGCASRNAIRI